MTSRKSATPESATPPVGQQDGVGVLHIAFKVGSYEALRESYDSLIADGVEVQRMMDHVSQRSLYFHDPDGNTLEVYYEYPNARELFLAGRGDEDVPFTWDDPFRSTPPQPNSATGGPNDD